MIDRPPVSIVLTHFNRPTLLAEALNSVAKWSTEDDDVVVVDDGSSKDAKEAMENAIDKYLIGERRVQLHFHATNLGGAAARNSAIQRAESEWIFCLDSDNLLTPGLLDRLVRASVQERLDIAVPEMTMFFDGTSRKVTHAWRYQLEPIRVRQHFSANKIVPSASGNYLFSVASWNESGGYPLDSGPLDTWAFGLRQVRTGFTMQAVPDTHYLHRYGHRSYWTQGDRREMRKFVDKMIAESWDSFDARERKILAGRRSRRVLPRRVGWVLVPSREQIPTLQHETPAGRVVDVLELQKACGVAALIA